MKKILFFAAALLCVTAANAKVWRINYEDNAQADFKTIKLCLAWNGFTEGDTLYMEPGVHGGEMGDNKITKSCTILGPGWGFQTSTNNISESESAIFTNTVCASGSTISVKISGICCNSAIGSVSGNKISSLIIEKCYYKGGGTYYPAADNLVIKNCLIDAVCSLGNNTTATVVGNVIRGYLDTNGTSGISLLVDHNTIVHNSSSTALSCTIDSKTTISNNIIINTSSKPDNVKIDAFMDPSLSVYNNVISFTTATIEAAEYTGDHTYDALKDPACTNKIDATVANTFKCHIDNGIVDNAMYYYVKDDAVAKTADSKGGECGAFGGDFPYQLNGRPNGVPYLYEINVPTHTDNNQLKISFKVAGNNE